jgi:hypothetical protein
MIRQIFEQYIKFHICIINYRVRSSKGHSLCSEVDDGLHIFSFLLVVPVHKRDEKYVTLSQYHCITKLYKDSGSTADQKWS